MMFVQIVADETQKVVQPRTLIRRYVLTRFYTAQHDLDELWRPPPMRLAAAHAATVRTVTMALLYGPLYPPVYLLASAAIFLSLWATKYAMSRWYRKPPPLNEAMLAHMRLALGLVILLHLTGVMLATEGRAGVAYVVIFGQLAVLFAVAPSDSLDSLRRWSGRSLARQRSNHSQ